MMAFESPFAGALNHLLEAEPWARERLAPFAGQTLELRAPPLPALRFAIGADGRLAESPGEAEVSLAITFSAGALPALARGEEYFLRAVDVSGNARLANEVMFLFRHLRWDVEEDLAKLVGDAAAHRLVSLAKDVAALHLEGARRVAEGVMEYAIEERRLLVPRGALDRFAADSARLRDGLERLDKRIEKLAGR